MVDRLLDVLSYRCCELIDCAVWPSPIAWVYWSRLSKGTTTQNANCHRTQMLCSRVEPRHNANTTTYIPHSRTQHNNNNVLNTIICIVERAKKWEEKRKKPMKKKKNQTRKRKRQKNLLAERRAIQWREEKRKESIEINGLWFGVWRFTSSSSSFFLFAAEISAFWFFSNRHSVFCLSWSQWEMEMEWQLPEDLVAIIVWTNRTGQVFCHGIGYASIIHPANDYPGDR